MKMFACVLDMTGRGIADGLRQPIEAVAIRRGLPFRWRATSGAWVLTTDPDGADLASHAGALAVGDVRLDNRADIARLINVDQYDTLTDLDLVVRLVALYKTHYIASLLGDFAFVVWYPTDRTAIAACDVFGVGHLFYTQRGDLTLFSSLAEPLSLGGQYDLTYLANRISVDHRMHDLTIYAGVRRVPSASTVVARTHTVSASQYWSAADVERARLSHMSAQEAIDTCRELFLTSVRLRVDPRGGTWSQLSGGLDSSSVVSSIEWMAQQGILPHRIAGTVTTVDGEGTPADETRFVNAVVEQWRVPNRQIVNAPSWYDETLGLPDLPDQPNGGSALDPGAHHQITIVRAAGGRVLLTGWGGDQLFTGNMLYLADQMAHGQVVQTMSELAYLAATVRGSFWHLAYKHAIRPLLPMMMQRRSDISTYNPPPYLHWKLCQELGLTREKPHALYRAPRGQKYRHFLAGQLATLEWGTDQHLLREALDLRHPFLYRPLVEFAASLPPELCVRVQGGKWILREAMRGILPELVRTRTGKGGARGMTQQMLAGETAFYKPLLQDLILGELGLVDARRLREAIDDLGKDKEHRLRGDIMGTLAIEVWLRIRSGRWPHGAIAHQQPARRLQPTELSVT